MPIDLLALGAALLSGVFGGVHCVAMCGGLATGLGSTGAAETGGGGWRHPLLLNVGRVGGYVVAGMLAGGVGAAVLGVVRIEGLAQLSRGLAGAVMLLVAARLMFPMRMRGMGRLGSTVWQRLRPWRNRLVPARGAGRSLMLGVFWGWLPCGLSSTLLMAAWLQASAVHGGLLMLAFGLGTLPLMVLLSWSGAHFARHLTHPAMRATAAGFIALAGMLTLLAPWLIHSPVAHAWLQALGCRSLLAG